MSNQLTIDSDGTLRLPEYSSARDLSGALLYIETHPTTNSLHLGSYSSISDNDFVKAAPDLKNIKSLYLGAESKITHVGFADAAKHFKNLESLHLGDRSKIDDLSAVAKPLKNLKSLSLGHASRIDKDGLLAATEHLKNLESLHLGNGYRISRDGLFAAMDQLPNLKSLHLGNDSNIEKRDKNRLIARKPDLVIDGEEPELNVDWLPLTEKISFILEDYLGRDLHEDFEGPKDLGYDKEGKLAKDIAEYATTLRKKPFSTPNRSYLTELKKTLSDAFPNAMEALEEENGEHKGSKNRVDDLMGDLLAAIMIDVSRAPSQRIDAAQSMASGYGVAVNEVIKASTTKQR
jgi:hypothetical protein